MRPALQLIAAMLATATAVCTASAQPGKLDTAAIEKASGLKGSLEEQEGVFRVTAARTDVKVKIDGGEFPPFMGLTSWAAFKTGMKAEAMVMGDLVLFEDEVNPVISTLFDSGLNVTALHNHFFFSEPQVYFMHIGGEGKAESLAVGVKAALDKVKAIRADKPTPPPARSFGGKAIEGPSSITAKAIEETLGQKSQTKDGMVKVTIGRTAKMECGCEVGKSMGVNTWAAFMGSDGQAIVCGDFAMTAEEVAPVLKALRKADINIVALHHHMIGEKPALYFVHYWGKGTAANLAAGVKSALDAQARAAAKPAEVK